MNENSKIYDWLVIFFLHEWDGGSGDINYIKHEIKQGGVTKNNCCILVHDNLDTTTLKYATNLYQLKLIDEARIQFDFIEMSYPQDIDFEFNDGRSWEYLLKILFKKFSSKKKIIVTASHGGGFAIGDAIQSPDQLVNNKIKLVNKRHFFTNRENNNQVEVLKKLFPAKNHNKQKEKIQSKKEIYTYEDFVLVKLNNNTDYCKNLELLWIAELADAIANTRQKIDIMYMGNCHMQLFDSAWLLRKVVKYYIANESFQNGLGYSYKRMLNTINSLPEIKSRDLAKKAIEQYIEKYSIDIPTDAHWLNHYAAFVNYLGYYYFLRICFNVIVFFIYKSRTKYISSIRNLRETVFQNVTDSIDPLGEQPETSPYQFIDLTYLLNTFTKLLHKNIIVKISFSLYKRILNKTVIARYIGLNYTLNDLFREKKFFHSGISIYFPSCFKTSEERNIAECAYFFTKQVDPFTQNTVWDEFLKYYLDLA